MFFKKHLTIYSLSPYFLAINALSYIFAFLCGKCNYWLFCTNFIFGKTANFRMAYFVTYFPNLKYLFPALYFIIIVECYQNGKRFTFRQNDDILRASSIIGGDTDGKSIERYIRCWKQW